MELRYETSLFSFLLAAPFCFYKSEMAWLVWVQFSILTGVMEADFEGAQWTNDVDERRVSGILCTCMTRALDTYCIT
jgi:hypothetical protein